MALSPNFTTDPLDPLLDQILHCFSHRVNRNQYLDPKWEPIAPVLLNGDSVVIDNCCPGYAWLRVSSAYPTVSFPNPHNGRVDCPLPNIAAELEIGIARCASIPDDNGNPPSAEDLTNDSKIVGVDRSILFQTATCCAKDVFGRDIRVGTWNPINTQGGCMGGVLNFTIKYPGCCDDLGDEDI